MKIEIAGDEKKISDWLGSTIENVIGSSIEVIWKSNLVNDFDNGILAVYLQTLNGVTRVD